MRKIQELVSNALNHENPYSLAKEAAEEKSAPTADPNARTAPTKKFTTR